MVLREPLDDIEARIFGALVEKQTTTPDAYPLSLNALVAACNQKSNRDPVMSLDTTAVEEALLRLRLHHLVSEVRATGARVVKYAHNGAERLELDPPSLAVLAELLLRGPQTPGELRGRAHRMSAVETLADLDAVLGPLEQRGLARRLPPAPGSRAARWTQLLAPGVHPDDETEPGRRAPGPGAAASPGAGASSPAGRAGPAEASSAATPGTSGPAAGGTAGAAAAPGAESLAALVGRLAQLEEEVARLRRSVASLRDRLGGQGDLASDRGDLGRAGAGPDDG